MSFATARTISLFGANGHLIDVQVDLSYGLVATALVGRPDTSITEIGLPSPGRRKIRLMKLFMLSPTSMPENMK